MTNLPIQCVNRIPSTLNSFHIKTPKIIIYSQNFGAEKNERPQKHFYPKGSRRSWVSENLTEFLFKYLRSERKNPTKNVLKNKRLHFLWIVQRKWFWNAFRKMNGKKISREWQIFFIVMLLCWLFFLHTIQCGSWEQNKSFSLSPFWWMRILWMLHKNLCREEKIHPFNGIKIKSTGKALNSLACKLFLLQSII